MGPSFHNNGHIISNNYDNQQMHIFSMTASMLFYCKLRQIPMHHVWRQAAELAAN